MSNTVCKRPARLGSLLQRGSDSRSRAVFLLLVCHFFQRFQDVLIEAVWQNTNTVLCTDSVHGLGLVCFRQDLIEFLGRKE